MRRDPPLVFEGYYNNDEATAERSRNGWYWSGDLGYRDADGVFYFAGRTADWIRVDGENFAAAPIERILGRHPDVAAVAVYAVPDPVTGDQVMAALELRAGRTLRSRRVRDVPRRRSATSARSGRRGSFRARRRAIPVTGADKVDKKPLSAPPGSTTDPVWWRPARGEPYRRLTERDAAHLAELLARARTDASAPG